jgi:hypothetical protein
MSGESAAHARLVERLIEVVRVKHSTPSGLVVFADHRSFGINRPQTIDGYLPDLYASDVPVTFRVVGEAKTADDLLSVRTALQLTAFCRHLGLYEGSYVYLAVPWHCAPRARCILRAALSEARCPVTHSVLGL